MKSVVIPLSLALLSSFFLPNSANAQINSDGSLSTQVDTSNNINFVINQGNRVGENLFHSFREFSIPTNGSAVFQNDLDIRNIFNRVTGGSLSTIDGLIQTQGNANFFLINPAGILFGQNARLEIGGSFFATTANSILFDDGIEFSATNLQTPLLTVNMPLGLRLRDNPKSITNQSVNFDSNGIPVGLQVKPGKTLALVGGDVNFNTGIISAPGARVELGGLAETGTIGLNNDGSLLFPKDVVRANVSLINLSSVNVLGGGEGSIAVNARNFDLLRGSTVFAGIASGQRTQSDRSGDIVINATDKVKIAGEANLLSNINNTVGLLSLGNAGDVIINAGSLEGVGSFAIGSATFGEGDAGKVSITTKDKISLEGLQNTSSGIVSAVSPFAIGNADDIVINTRSLFLSNFTLLGTSTLGQGNAGNIRINASEIVSVKSNSVMQAVTGSSGNAGKIVIEAPNADVSLDGLGTGVSTAVSGKIEVSGIEFVGTGQGGDVSIQARNLFVTNGARIITSTSGQAVPNNELPNAGNITLNVAGSVNLTRGSQLRSDTDGQGNAGMINVSTGTLSLTEGSQLLSSTFREKNAGNVIINATGNVSFDGVNTIFGSEIPNSGVFSNVESGATGDGGDINIKAGALSITNGAQVQTVVRRGFGNVLPGRGNSGKVTIAVDGTLKLDGVSEIFNFNGLDNSSPSVITTLLDFGSSGSAGEIDITARELFVTNGAQLSTSTFGQGNAGNVTIIASESITFDGFNTRYENGVPAFFNSGVQSNVVFGAIGDGGNLKITGRNLSLSNGAQINTSTFGRGNAGKVNIDVREAVNLSGFSTTNFNGINIGIFNGISSEVGETELGNGGDINIKARSLSMNDSSFVSTATFGRGNAGKVSVEVDDSITLANLSNIRSNVGSRGEGISGDISIKARSLTLTDGSQISAIVLRERKVLDNGKERIIPGGKGRAGNIDINATDFVNISGVSNVQFPVIDPLFPSTIVPTTGFSSGLLASAERGSTATDPQGAGNITVTTGDFRLADGAVVDALTTNSGAAGNITINAKTFTAIGGGQVITTTRSSGDAGSITLNISDRITLSGSDPNFNQRVEQAQRFGEASDIVNNQGSGSGIFANTTLGSQGDGGNIFIDPRYMVIQDGAGVAVNSQGEGKGGNIEIQAGNLTLDNRAFISAETTSNQGGNITLKINDVLQLRRNSNISTTAGTTRGPGDGGNITIDSKFLVGIPREDSNITANSFGGKGGAINITTQGIFGLAVRDRLTPLSDITAFSQLSPTLNGEITLNIPDVDPSQGLVEFPQTIIDPDALVAQNPCARRTGSEFIITGKGGLPLSPNQALSEDVVGLDLVEPAPSIATQKLSSTNDLNNTLNQKNTSINTSTIVPAQGWVINERDEVILTAYSANGNGIQRQTRSSQGCPLK
ncbi:filamentous hemagglutinin N-terminal domain-containing protein [Scytonema sp. UIC 10036]|uniref:two-partner secretion domain-containing protein n=1 Tax=Scytonema sp. UIC 10036 TaxID=2304196 RepID=UPI00140FACC7|nr:filamentous hemagglutinin N-terminal domain-containing protein [Scytonema sp. UIC 10036]